MSTDFDYDPERALWKPNRRSFFFGFGSVCAAYLLPDVPTLDGWESVEVDQNFAKRERDSLTRPLNFFTCSIVAQTYMMEIKFATKISSYYSDQFLVPGISSNGTVNARMPGRFPV